MKRNSNNYKRAQKLVIRDKFDFHEEVFSKDLHTFLSDYFQFDRMSVQVNEGESVNMVITINVSNVKKTRIA